MNIVLQGSRNFNSYEVFMRAMGVALSPLKNNREKLYIMSAGPYRVSSFAKGFSNLIEQGMIARGMDVKMTKVSHKWVEDNMDKIDHFIYLSTPYDRDSRLTKLAEAHNVETTIFRY